MQIRTKLTLQFTLLVSAIICGSFILIYVLADQYTSHDFHKRLRQKAISSAILLLKVEEVDSTLLKTIDLYKKDNLYRENISIYDDQGFEIYTSNDTIHFDTTQSLFTRIKKRGDITFSRNEFSAVGILFSDQDKRYTLLAEAIDSDGRTRLMTLRKLLSLLFVVLVAIVGWAGWFYSGRALAPIKKVMNEVERISTVNLSHRLQESKNPDEIGKLVIIFNHLLSRIDNAFTLQKTFVSNVSHELKNPLTKITSQLEVTLFKDRLATEYKETIQSVLEDIKELNHLSNSLLDLASLSQPEVSISTTKVRIDEILWEIRDIVQSINPAYKVNFHTVSMPLNEADLYLQANSHLLKIAIQNLIENACKFSDDNVATVSLFCSPTELEIRIFDKGPGIEPTELQNIFQPFYRSNKTSQVKGHGIGLSLSQRIIDLHNGAIEIESTLGEGTQVTVVFYTQL